MNKYKIVGIATIAAIILLIINVAFLMWRNEKRAENSVLVQFSEMGALQNQDLVTIRGFEIGVIASITRANEKALVEIDLHEPRAFRKDTRFRNISPNIMGSRSIIIEPGTEGEVAPKGHVFDGEFEPGFAEVLALTDVAKKQVEIIMSFVRMLHTGDEDNPSFQKTFEELLIDCEDLIVALENTVTAVERETIGMLDKVSWYSEEIADAGIVIGESLDSIRVKAEGGINSAENVVANIKGTIENLENILNKFEQNPVTVALLDKKEIIDDIDSLRSTLQAFVGNIDQGGIKIYDEDGKRKSMVSFKNIHIFRENARDKIKKENQN